MSTYTYNSMEVRVYNYLAFMIHKIKFSCKHDYK
nr:MAG TPA: hypothetical protein [Bacteriophage sp.]